MPIISLFSNIHSDKIDAIKANTLTHLTIKLAYYPIKKQHTW